MNEVKVRIGDVSKTTVTARTSTAPIPYIGDNGNWYINNTDSGKPSRGEQGIQGEKGAKGVQGVAGKDGVSPTAKVEQTETGATVTVTDASGTTTAELTNGKDGETPEITSEAIVSALGYTPEKQSGTFELIETITLEEDTASIIRTQEPDGTPYAFTALGVVVQAEVAEKNCGLQVQCNYNGSVVQAAFINGVFNTAAKKYGYARVYQSGGIWYADGSTAADGYNWTVNQVTGYSISRAYNQKVSDMPCITSLSLYPNVSGAVIPAGTIIQIYGVRA